MIIGVIASTDYGEAAGSVTYIADFVNGIYTADGESMAAADVVSRVDTIGASGLQVGVATSYDRVFLLDPFLSVLTTAHWSIALEFEITDGFAAAPLTVTDVVGGLEFLFVASMNDSYPAYVWDSVNFGTRREAFDAGTSRPPGIYRIAATRTDDLLAVSFDREAAISSSLPRIVTGTVASAQFGGYEDLPAWNDDVRIRYLEIRPSPVSTAFLPFL